MNNFMGLAGLDFIGAIERWIGGPLPDDFHDARAEEDARALGRRAGGGGGRGRLHPRAAARAAQGDRLVELDSNGSTRHLAHLGLAGAFGDMIFSRPRACRARQAGARPLSPRRRRARRADRPHRDHRGFAGRRRRRGRLGRRGDRPRRRPPLPARPRRAAARARRPPHRPRFRRGGGAPRLELVPAAVALGGEIGAVVLAFADLQRHALDDPDPFRLQRRHLPAGCW